MNNESKETVGFIDLGTNSVHLLVVNIINKDLAITVFADKKTVRLGQTLYTDGKISEETIRLCKTVVFDYIDKAKQLGASRVLCFATSAARDASNGDSLINELKSDVLDMRIISGVEEAKLIRLGIFGSNGPEVRTLTIDIGGGSTEITLSEGKNIDFVDSLQLGAVRMSYGSGFDVNNPISDDIVNSILSKVELNSKDALCTVKSIGFERVVGSSGTLLAIASMAATMRGDENTSYFRKDELKKMMDDLRDMSSSERAEYNGLGKTRSDIVIGGGYIAYGLMELLGIERIDISDNGLREGMLLDYMKHSF